MATTTNDLHELALRRVLRAETWRRERILNTFRFAFLILLGLSEWRGRSGFDHAHLSIMPFVFLFWGITIGVLNVTVLRRLFHPWFPAAITTIDILVLTVAILVVYDHAVRFEEPAAQEIERAFIGLFLLLSVNAIRFSWRTTLWSGLCAIASLWYLRVHSGTLVRSAVLTDFLAIAGFVALLVYSNRTVRAVIERLLVDIRSAQERRLSSLRSLVAGLTHEINSPLAAIEANAQIFKRASEVLEERIDTPPPETVRTLNALREASATSRDAVSRISKIVRALGEFARLDEVEVTAADLRRSLDTCIGLLAADTGDRIEIVRRYEALPAVSGRQAQINQALMHVLRNAVQSMAGTGRITIEGSRDGDEAVITVSDTGRGIPKSRLSDILDLQLRSKGDRVGMGLGLPISNSIIQDHGGTLQIDSVVGSGTTVTIRLPAASPTSKDSRAR